MQIHRRFTTFLASVLLLFTASAHADVSWTSVPGATETYGTTVTLHAAGGNNYNLNGSITARVLVTPPGLSQYTLNSYSTYHAITYGGGTILTSSSPNTVVLNRAGTWRFEVLLTCTGNGSTYYALTKDTLVSGAPATPTSFTVTPRTFTFNGGSQGPGITPSPGNATWSVTAGQQNAVNAGSYSVTATANGSYTGSSGPIGWTINQAGQSVSVSPGNTTITAGQSVTFNASGGQNGYNWGGSASGTGSSKTVSFGSPGNYTVNVYSPNAGNYSQSNTATAYITVNSSETWAWEYWWSGWYATTGWSPDPSTVTNGQYFTQTRSIRRDQYGRERSSFGNIRNDNTFITYETSTESQGAYGSYIAPYNSVAFSSFSVSPVYPSGSVAAPVSFTNNGTKPWGGAHYIAIRDASYNGFSWISTSGLPNGGSTSSTFTWTAPASAGSYPLYYTGLENGIEWFGAVGSFTLNVANRPTTTITADATTIAYGQSTTIRANYIVDSARGDSLIETAINAVTPTTGETTVSGYGPGNLTYALTASSIGTHTFYAYLRTGIAPSWANAGSVSVTVTPANQSPASITSPTTVTFGNSYTATATGGSGTGAYVWALGAGSTASGASINASTGAVTATSAGTVVINVYRAASTNYYQSATTANFTITVNPKPVTFSVTPLAFTYDGFPHGPMITSSDPSATFGTSGTASATSAGAYVVTANATGNYSGSSGGIAWNINPASQAVTISPVSQTIVVGGSISFTAAGGVNAYTWGGTAGATGSGTAKAFTFASLGSYTVTVQSVAGSNYAASNVASATIAVVSPATLSVSGSTDFGTIGVWSGSPLTSTQTFTLSNTGGVSLSVSTAGTSGDYVITAINAGAVSYPLVIAAGGSATMTITFNATAPGTRAGSLSITNTSANAPNYSVALTGIGSEGRLSPGWSIIRTE